MLIHGTNSNEMPLLIDTTRIDATYCRQDQHGLWQVVLILSNGKDFILPHYNSIKINGVNITHKGEMEGCKKMAEVINTILELERQDPPIDMDKFSKLSKDVPKRKIIK